MDYNDDPKEEHQHVKDSSGSPNSFGKQRIRFSLFQQQEDEMITYWASITPLQRLTHLHEMVIASFGLTKEQLKKSKLKSLYKSYIIRPMNIFFDEHRKLLVDMLNEDVQFILAGGYAVNYHGYNRTTGDMDIWLKPDNENKFKVIITWYYLKLRPADYKIRMTLKSCSKYSKKENKISCTH